MVDNPLKKCTDSNKKFTFTKVEQIYNIFRPTIDIVFYVPEFVDSFLSLTFIDIIDIFLISIILLPTKLLNIANLYTI